MPDVLETGSVVAGYRIARLIGRGATGAVYLAADAEGNEVALKVLLPDLAQDARFRERFLRESQIAASLDEPHVVPTLAVGEDDGMLYLAMRFVDGLDLREVLKREGPLSPERAVDLIGQVAGALDAAHALGLVHRDVKPGNVLVLTTDAGEHAYLCDFGLAKHVSSVNSLTGGAGARRHDRVHLARADRGRGDRRAGRRLLARVHALRVPHRAGAVRARDRDRDRVRAHERAAPARDRRAAGHSRRLRHRRRESAREGAGRPLRELRRAGRGERVRSAWRAAAPQPVPAPPRSWALLAVAAVAAAAVVGGIVLSDDGGGGGGAAAPRLAIAPKSMGLIDAVSHKVVARLPFASQPWDVVFDARQAWVLLGDERRVARVDLASHKVLSSTRLPFSPGAIATGGGVGLGHRGRRPGTRASRRDDRADREDVLGPDPGRSHCEPDRHRLRGRLGLGRARAGDGARRPRRRAGPAPHPDPAGGDGRSSSPRERSGSRAPRTGGS